MQLDSSTTPLYVGIDIGKNVHCYGGYSGGELHLIGSQYEVRNNQPGYENFRSWLQMQVGSQLYNPIVVGLEPTGIYHEAWAYAIQQDFGDQINFRFLNPYQTRQKRRQLQNGRKKKTDPIDVEAIAYCLRDGQGNPACLPGQQTIRFDLWAAEFRQAYREYQRLQLSILTQWDRLWPGVLVDVKAFQEAHPHLKPPKPLVLSRPLERQLIRFLLSDNPNPYYWRTFTPQSLHHFLHAKHLHCGPITAQRVYNAAHEALLPPQHLAESLSVRLQNDFQRFLQLDKHLEQLQQQAEILVPQSPAAVLTTVPGIGAYLAAQYLPYVVDPLRFDHADQIWSMAGFDVEQDDSGDRRRMGRITRRGDPAFRKVLFSIGLNTSQYCPAIAHARQQALKHGKKRIGAVIHAAHKANRMCFYLLSHQVPYDPRLTH
jgi:transposase